MKMQYWLYSEINIFCIVILSILFWKTCRNIDKRKSHRVFLLVLLTNILTFIPDVVWSLNEGGALILSTTANSLVNCIYFSMTVFAAFFWFAYAEMVIASKISESKWCRNLIIFPVLLFQVFDILSLKTGHLFYVDKNNCYHRGDFYFIQMLLVCVYLLAASIHSFCSSLKRDNYAYKSKYRSLAFSAVCPLIFSLLEVIMQGLPTSCVGVTLAILLVYLSFLEQSVSTDSLTQLNNRNELLRFLTGKMKHTDGKHSFYLLVLDVDYFKKINDRFGHLEGDHALIMVAEALRKVCHRFGYFASRYGGDEFILIASPEEAGGIDALCKLIQEYLEKEIQDAHINYSLKLSIGYAEYSEQIHSIQHLIHTADSELYRVKKLRSK